MKDYNSVVYVLTEKYDLYLFDFLEKQHELNKKREREGEKSEG